MSAGSTVLKSELAGIWYSEDPLRLAREIDVYLDAVEAPASGDVMALLLPHAGYRYSGMVAAMGVKQIAGRTFSRVVVIGPSHRTALLDSVSIPDVDYVETPLGRIELDRGLMQRLWENPRFQSHLNAHAHEHSVQIELPFLQRALGDFKLVPIVCGELSEQSARQIGATLLQHIDSETLVIISSDFTHYGRGFDYVPFSDNIQANLEILDMNAFRLIEEKNFPGFLQYIQETRATICGRSPIAVLLAMLPPKAEVELLKYETSGNLTGDWMHCVSYVSAAITGQWKGTCADGELCEREYALSESDKIGLLRLARYCIAKKLKPKIEKPALEITPAMQEIMGCFVTLYRHGRLRGCVGEIIPKRRLYDAVKVQAINAAFKDDRFPGLREEELSDIDIEISALTAPHRINSHEDIEIGKHGVVLYQGKRSAVFLPHVACEQKWGVVETLSHLAMKAGLAPDAWQSDCEVHVFETIVFSERRK